MNVCQMVSLGCVLGVSMILTGGAMPQEKEYPVLVDVTEQAGITYKHCFGDDFMDNIVESTGAGCTFFDYDGDGDIDIYIVNGTYLKEVNHIRGRKLAGTIKNQLFRNNGDGTFTDVTEKAGVGDTGFGMASLSGDYDNDGDADLFVTNYGPNVFYRNNGDGTFTNVTKEVGVESNLWGIGCTFLDYDQDGFLDLYVGNYIEFDPEYRLYYPADVFPGPLSYHGQPDILYHNNGDGTFTDVTEKAGVGNPQGRAMGVASCDIDNDGDMDIFVANDAMENYLYQNNGDGTFTDIALLTGTGFGQNGEATSAMGPEFGDFNNDGFIDLMVPDMNYGCLYKNTGQGYFEEMGAQMGTASVMGQYVSWSGNFFDYDNDNYIDIFISNGDAHKMEPEEDLLFVNVKGEKFVDISAKCGKDFQDKFISRGSAVGDFDNDGDLDILELNVNDRARLLRNDGGNKNNWLMIDVEGTKSNRDGYGTRIRLTVGDITQTRDVVSSSGYLSQSDSRAHFGLNAHTKADKIEIRWPDGKLQTLENVAANQILKIKEPE